MPYYTPGLAALNIRPPQSLGLQNVLGLMRLQNGGGLGGQMQPPNGGLADISRVLGAGNVNQPPPPSTPPPGNGGSDLDRAIGAISRIESGGNYSALGPQTNNGARAYGRFQVMDFNVGPWTERWFGRRLTPEEFRNSPEAQDAVFRGQFGMYMNRYGPAGAASMWFTGRPNAPNARDILGTSGAEYVRRFLEGYR
jgi:hypothetical protein